MLKEKPFEDLIDLVEVPIEICLEIFFVSQLSVRFAELDGIE